jgi:hypothetical protein
VPSSLSRLLQSQLRSATVHFARIASQILCFFFSLSLAIIANDWVWLAWVLYGCFGILRKYHPWCCQIHSNAIVYSLPFYYHYYYLIWLISCMTKIAYSLTLLLVGLCTVSAAFMKCSPVYQLFISVGFLDYHRRLCLKNKKLPVIHACSHKKKAINLPKKKDNRKKIKNSLNSNI